MRILALDIAANTGWAFGVSGLEKSGSQRFASENLGEFADGFERWLVQLIAETQPDILAVEAPVPVRGTTTLKHQLRAYGAHAIAAKVAFRTRIDLLRIGVGTWRSWFIGTSKAPKEIMTPHLRRKWLKQACLDECAKRGWPVSGDDEADAIGVLSYAIESAQVLGQERAA